MYNFLKEFDNPEKFNEKFIYMKRDDDLLSYINDIASALEVVEGIKYLGGTLNTDESLLKTRSNRVKLSDNTSQDMKWISIKESRLNTVTLKFKIEMGDKSEIIEKTLLFPKLIDDFYFIINGSRYYPIYQIIDAATYKTPKSLTLKTLLMPIVIKNEKKTFTDHYQNEFNTRVFILDLFKHRINILHYYFANMGVTETIRYFGYSEEEIGIVSQDDIEFSEDEGFKFYNISNDMVMYVNDSVFDNVFGSDFVGMLIDMFNSKNRLDHVDNIDYWKRKLGSIFTKNTNAQMEKADKIILSFKRILDNRTKQILRIDDEYKDNTFGIAKWMMMNYDDLSRKDNMSLSNKRLRVNEYLLHPLLIRFSTSTYRLLNSKNVTFTNLKSIFNTLSPNFVISKLIQNELLRYHNAVNAIDLFTCALKFSYKGPQSISESGSSVNIRYRGLHTSYLGRIGLTACSSSDPGMTGTFVPFIATDGFFFTKSSDEEENNTFIDPDENE